MTKVLMLLVTDTEERIVGFRTGDTYTIHHYVSHEDEKLHEGIETEEDMVHLFHNLEQWVDGTVLIRQVNTGEMGK